MGWSRGGVAVAMAAMFLLVSFAPMASSVASAEKIGAAPTAGKLVNSKVSGRDHYDPKVFAAGNGMVYVVWEEVASGLSRIWFAYSTDDGATFSTPSRVDDLSSGSKCQAITPAIAVDSTGTILLVWCDNSTTAETTDTYQVRIRTVDSLAPLHFTDARPVFISSQWKNQTNPDLAIEDDDLFLVWSEYEATRNNYSYIKLSRSLDGGDSFSPPLEMPDSPDRIMQQYPSISVRGSKVVVAWHDSRLSNPLFQIYCGISTNNGQTFTVKKASSTGSTYAHYYPSAEALPDGRVLVVWQEKGPDIGDTFDIRGAIYSGGASFGTVFDIDASANDQSAPTTSVDPRGVVTLTYRSVVSGMLRVMYARSNDAATFLAPTQVDPSGGGQKAPDCFSVQNGTAYLVYQDDIGGDDDVFLSKVVNERPLVDIQFPASGSVLSKSATVAGSCSDPDTTPIFQVEVQVKETAGAVVLPWTLATVTGGTLWNFTVNTSQITMVYGNGQYEVYARSYDGALYSVEDELDVTFDNGIQPFVDLRITSADIQFFPADPNQGDGVTISADVTNVGNTDAENVQVQFFRGTYSLGYRTMSRVAAGATNNTVFSWTAIEGTFTFRVTVDPNDQFDEPNEDDNTATKDLTVGPAPILKPDLAITPANITITPAIAHVDEELNVSAKVTNDGQIFATNIKVQLEIDGLYLTHRFLNSIMVGEFKYAYFNWTPTTTGYHTITVIVDPLPRVQNDSDYDNNMAIKPIDVYSQDAFKADLQISNATVILSPGAPKIGQNLTVSVIVNNLGDIPAEAVQVSFYMDTLLIGTRLIPVVQPEMGNDTSIVWQASLGSHTLIVWVDEGDEIVEANESNNQVVRLFNVTPLDVLRPNLYVDAKNITTLPSPPEKGKAVKFNVTVWNLGNDSAAGVVVVLRVDGQQIGSPLSIGFLEPGDHVALSGNWMATAGKHTFEVVVDPSNTTAEWNEGDNTAQMQFELPGDPISTDVLLLALAVVAFAVLGFGAYSFMKARARKKSK